MVKDILKIVIALLIVLAIAAGLAYLFMGPMVQQVKDEVEGAMARKTMVDTAQDTIGNVFKGGFGQ